MSNITKNNFLVLAVVCSFHIVSSSKNQVGRKSKMTDSEVVTLSLSAEFMLIDSENYLFKLINGSKISNLKERSQFNKRKRKLF